MSPLYCALVHHPIVNRIGEIVATAITNIDVHDLARSARVYDLGAYFIITPVHAQRLIVERIVEHWRDGPGTRRVPERGEALGRIRVEASVEEAVAVVEALHGRRPRLLATAARSGLPGVRLRFAEEARALASDDVPRLILFGTGHGLADSVLEMADGLLEPIRGGAEYNHLSVRAAAAITLDRLVGESLGASSR
ncbi:MAG: RNA methyltransferase [Myxococcales bacterium]|nr:RNA methyltransferase [Myxococcales bacterium]